MGRYIEQNESRSELQQRIAADLRAKAATKDKQEGEPGGKRTAPAGVEDAAYLKGTKSTTTLAPLWLLIFIAAILVFVFFVYRVNH